MIRYGTRFLGCKQGQVHDLQPLHDTIKEKWEVCKICNKKFKWNKGFRGRTENVQYLYAHVRSFAQPTGSTKRVYRKIYDPESCIIYI